MNILFLVFGSRLSDHLQAQLSMLTFMRGMSLSDKLNIITTNPEFYSRFDNLNIITISRATLDEWEGEYHFFWRVKIKAIEYMSENYPCQDLMYVDSDTFLRGRLDDIKHCLSQGKGLMHLDEGHPSTMHTKSLRMWKQVAGKCYGGVTLTASHNMWNAGVVAIPGVVIADTVSLALQLCDGMLADGAERVVIEQYSLSIALKEKTTLIPASKWIGHYWGNKEEWNAMASEFFLKSYMTGRSLQQELIDIDTLNLDDMHIHIKKSNTKRHLNNIIGKVFKDKVVE